MSPFTIVVVAFLLGLLVMSLAFAGGAVIVTLPLAVIGIAVIGFVDFRRRREQSQSVSELHDEAKAEKVDFTARDKETLASSD